MVRHRRGSARPASALGPSAAPQGPGAHGKAATPGPATAGPVRRTAVDSAWFARRLGEIGETQRTLARFLGSDPSIVSKMLGGVRRIRLDEAERLARFLRVPLIDVLEHAGVAVAGVEAAGQGPATVEHPAQGAAAALVGLVDGDGRIAPWRGPPEEILLPLGAAPADPASRPPAALLALRLEDAESLMDGWTFFYRPSARVEAAAVGRLAVVRRRGERAERLAVVEVGGPPDGFRISRFDGRQVAVPLASAAPMLLIRP